MNGSIRHTNGIWIPDHDSLPHLAQTRMDRPPIKLIVSLIGMCNLRCFHCLGSSEQILSTQNKSNASRELIDFVVDQVVPEVRAVRLGGNGYTEQMISRRFDYFLERMQPHAPILGSFELITNLSVMTERRADLLAGSLTELQVSLEGVEENFTRLRGFAWHKLVKHFRIVGEAKRRNPGSRMKISLTLCGMSDMLDDLLRFDIFQDLGVEHIILRELQPLVEHHQPQVLYREPEKTRAFIGEFRRRAQEAGISHDICIAERYERNDAKPPVLENVAAGAPPVLPSFKPCTLPFEVLSVVHTGQFGVCCYVTDLAGPFDNNKLSALSIMDVWNDPAFVKFRARVNSPLPPTGCVACEIKAGHLNVEERAMVLETNRRQMEADRRSKLDAEEEERYLRSRLDGIEQLLNVVQTTRAYALLRLIGRWRWFEHALANDATSPTSTTLASREHLLEIVQTTRAYRWLRRMGRWQHFEDAVAQLRPEPLQARHANPEPLLAKRASVTFYRGGVSAGSTSSN